MSQESANPPRDSDTASSGSQVTVLLEAWRAGDDAARDELLPLVYQHLQQLAHQHFGREHGPRTLQPTALVHEVYLRLVDAEVDWRSRAHFFAVAGRLMRRLLVDESRRRARLKRGGERPLRLDDLSQDPAAVHEPGLLELHDALERLARFDARKAEVLEARVFAGLTIRETSEVLEISTATVERELRLARAWLARELLGNEA